MKFSLILYSYCIEDVRFEDLSVMMGTIKNKSVYKSLIFFPPLSLNAGKTILKILLFCSKASCNSHIFCKDR